MKTICQRGCGKTFRDMETAERHETRCKARFCGEPYPIRNGLQEFLPGAITLSVRVEDCGAQMVLIGAVAAGSRWRAWLADAPEACHGIGETRAAALVALRANVLAELRAIPVALDALNKCSCGHGRAS